MIKDALTLKFKVNDTDSHNNIDLCGSRNFTLYLDVALNFILKVLLDGLYDRGCPFALLRGCPHIMGKIWEMLVKKWDLFPVEPFVEVEGVDAKHSSVEFGVPVGAWRSPPNSINVFYTESVVDELAFINGVDPLEYRL